VFTEIGRQPFVVYPNPDVPVDEQVWFFTAQAVSPGVTVAEVWTSLISLGLLYGALAVVELFILVRLFRRGVTTGDTTPTPPAVGSSHPSDDDRRDGDRADDDVLSFAY
jgi:cytochrome d ubiquinol oxidase subunit I